MSKITVLRVANFLGIDEQELEASKINIFKGPKGKGKSSLVEAIEKSFTNKNRRTEVVKHGEEEATLYVELDDGLEITRKVRNNRSDYLKIRKADEGVPSTEKFLKSLVNGEIFRPIDWINLSIREQTKSLLSMLEIGWSEQDIINWFGDLVDDIDYSQHILIILKNIELKYYKIREEVNREIKELKARIDALYEELPLEYNGEEWRYKNIQEYYKKVTEAQNINKWISEAKTLQSNFNDRVNSIKSMGENEKNRITLKYKAAKEDIEDIIALSNGKIEKCNRFIENSDRELELQIQKIKTFNEKEKLEVKDDFNLNLIALEEEYRKRKAEIENNFNTKIKTLDSVLVEQIDSTKKSIFDLVNDQKELIRIQENKISAKNQELLGLDEKENLDKLAVDEKVKSEIEKEEIRVGKSVKYLEEHEEIEIEPLQKEADKVVEMVGYLKDWNRISEIRDGILASKESYSKELTAKIDKARNLPGELLKTAKMPVEGISVDVDGRVRINGTLIDGLSDGEKLELAMRIAKAQCGALKVICLDRFEALDSKAQEVLLEEMASDEYQYFVTQVAETENDELVVEKIG